MQTGQFPISRNTARSDWIRLRTLIMLRWLAVAGQGAAVLVATQFLNIQLRLDLCLLAIAASAAFNIVAIWVNPVNKRLNEASAMLSLMFDLTQLGVLLYLTGGLSNPFSLLVLAPVTISATALTLPSTVVLGAFAVSMISTLVVFNIPLMTTSGQLVAPPPLFIAGNWAALVIGIGFLAGYARRVTNETFSMSQALSATQMALEREQKLTALGGVVAAAAHELGTPLATIKLVSSELEDDLADHPDQIEDIRLIKSQAERCSQILRDMGRTGRDDRHMRFAPLLAVVEEAAEPHLNRGKLVVMRVDGAAADEAEPDQPVIARQSEIIHGLRNLVQNAVDFADTTVWIDMFWDDTSLTVIIGDDGIGYPPELLGRIGDPFVTRRSGPLSRDRERPNYVGMGLGLFIAKTLLERTGAALSFGNSKRRKRRRDRGEDIPVELRNATGAVVHVKWPRGTIEADAVKARGPLGPNSRNTS